MHFVNLEAALEVVVERVRAVQIAGMQPNPIHVLRPCLLNPHS